MSPVVQSAILVTVTLGIPFSNAVLLSYLFIYLFIIHIIN